ncbi:reverse transcriptase [Caerostris extrusa]|uniref:Reverse transcriptase n=1 Tax=Caerostris extrusa TaxID=172846 RepID=A0AAV4QD92_CAEEX|nr:reverse transcriptase [Caerostris extrusa]
MRKKILCMVCKRCEVTTMFFVLKLGSLNEMMICPFLYPILLPSKYYLTECLIKRISFKALSCSVQLPLNRVRESAIFKITGIDLCGPLLLKPRGKAWIVLFTCAVYRAIHLEPLTSLSTESFMQALRRFIARRGRPSTAYTDNATNFRGTDNALKQIDWQKISENECYPIKWKFNPSTTAWWGRWERLIRSVKSLLVRILGRSSVNFEELLTILCASQHSAFRHFIRFAFFVPAFAKSLYFERLLKNTLLPAFQKY